MIDMGAKVLIKGEIIGVTTDSENSINYKVRLPIMDGRTDVWIQAKDAIETKED